MALSDARRQVLHTIADAVENLTCDGIPRIGIDGVDGAGKTTFADQLAEELRTRHTEVVRASADDFHRPRDERYRRGRHSPEGFYLDTYDLPQLRDRLLDPLGPGGDRRYVRRVHDLEDDRAVVDDVEVARDGQVLVLDGMFLHRPELRGVWELSVFLDVPFPTSVGRLAARDGSPADPSHPRNRRYVEGQRLYLRRDRPSEHATFVVDNRDLHRPSLVRAAVEVGS